MLYFWASIYKITLEIIYATIISPLFSYEGLVLEPNLIYCLISYSLFYLLLFITPKKRELPSHQLSGLFFFTTITPLLSLFWQANKDIFYVIYASICYVVLSLILRYIKPFRIPFYKKDRNVYRVVHLVFCSAVCLLILYTITNGTIDARALDFSSVYELRNETKALGIWAYVVNWLGKLLLPFCIVIYMCKRQKKLFLISCLMQVYLYLCTGNKTTLFSVILIIGCTYLLRNNKFKLGIPKLYSCIILGSALLYIFMDFKMSIAIFPTRQLVLPALISFNHYDFFSQNTMLYFSESLLGWLMGTHSPYSMLSTFLVSSGEGNANTGYLADAYDNGGFFVMVMFTVLLALILLFIDSVSRFSTKKFQYSALMVYQVATLNDAPLLTMLLTGGLGFLLIFMYFLASEEYTMRGAVDK